MTVLRRRHFGLCLVALALASCGKSNLETPREKIDAIVEHCAAAQESPGFLPGAFRRCLRTQVPEIKRLGMEVCKHDFLVLEGDKVVVNCRANGS